MALVTSNQFQLVPELSRAGAGFAQGQAIGAARDARQVSKLKTQQAQQSTQFAGQALAGDSQALTSLAQTDPGQAVQIQKFLASQSDADRAEGLRENDVLTRTALNALSLPPEQQRAFLVQERQKFITEGRDTTNIDSALALDDAGLNQALNFQAKQGLALADVAKRQFPEAKTAETSLQKNLIAAGLTPGTPEFEAAILKSTQKPLVSIGGEKKFKEAVATGQAKTFARVGEEADAAIDANQSLDVLEAIDVDTGALEPAKQGIAAFARAFGIDSSRLANVSKGEAFNAEAQRIVLSVKASQKGPQTDKDEVTIRKTVASLGNTKAGNQFIIDSARALNNRRIERKDFYDGFIQDNDGSFRNEQGVTADRAWSEFKRKTPMISSTMRTPEGLPVFFYKFEQDVRNANPDATREEIIEVWKQQNKRAK